MKNLINMGDTISPLRIEFITNKGKQILISFYDVSGYDEEGNVYYPVEYQDNDGYDIGVLEYHKELDCDGYSETIYFYGSQELPEVKIIEYKEFLMYEDVANVLNIIGEQNAIREK